MGNRSTPGYHGRYTVSEFAMVKGELLKLYGNKWSANDLDKVCRFVAKHNWPAVRTESYTAAAEFPNFSGAMEAAARMLLVYDKCQELFDLYHSGPDFHREYQALPQHVQNFLEKISDDDGERHRDNQADRGLVAGAGEAAP